MRRSLPAIVLPVAAALALAGCGGDSDPAPTSATSTATSAATSAAPSETTAAETTSETVTDTATATETATDTGTGGGTPGELTEPGTELSLGDTATVEEQTGKEGDDYYSYATLDLTIDKIEEGDPAVLEKFDNAEDFEGYVPYYIRYTTEILSLESAKDEVNGNINVVLYGTLKGGAQAGKLIAFGGFDEVCATEYPEKVAVGAVTTGCTVALAPEGTEVVGAEWEGDSDIKDTPYADSPISWK